MTARLERRMWWGTFGTALLVFLATAHWWAWVANDTQASDWASWGLAHGYGNDLSTVPHVPVNTWFVHVGPRLVASRMPGVVLAGLPAQTLLAPFHLRPELPGALTACVLTAAAVANLGRLLHRLHPQPRTTLSCLAALTFGTSVWTVCAAELWTHSVDVFALSLLMLAWQSGRLIVAGAAVPLLVLNRPHLSLVVATVGLWWAWRSRRLAPILVLGGAGLCSLVALLVWNHWMFGTYTLGSGQVYVDTAQRLTGSGPGGNYALNVAGLFVSPYRGVFLYSPVVALATACLILRWRATPSWTRVLLLGGCAYELVQLRLNLFTGGAASFSNRLVVELLVLGTPAAFFAYLSWREAEPRVATVARVLTAASVSLHLLGALFAGAQPMGEQPHDVWTTWLLGEAIGSRGASALVVSSLMVLLVAGGFLAGPGFAAKAWVRSSRGRTGW